MPRGRQLSDKEQTQIRALSNTGLSNRSIGRQLLRAPSLIGSYLKTSLSYYQRKRTGRPRILSVAEVKRICRMTADSAISTEEIRRILGTKASRSTIWRAIKKNNKGQGNCSAEKKSVMSDTEVAETGDERGPISEIFGPGPQAGVSYPLNVKYCGACTLPIEYCEYAGMKDECKKWIEENAPELLENLQISEPAEGDEKKHQKRGGKGSKPVPDKKKGGGSTGPSKITLQREPRGKKNITVIKGLAANGIELKQATKFFASRFACGSSVTATDEVIIQGDCKDILFDLIPEKWAQVDPKLIDDLGDKKR